MLVVRKCALVLAALLATSATQACSVCIAHAFGAGIHAIGSQTLHKGATVVGISYTTFSKSQAGEDPGTTESHDQHEIGLDVLHSLNDQLMLRANVPYVVKQLSMTGEEDINMRGLGDITLGAKYQFKPRPADKVLLSASFDLKLPTGQNNLKDAVGDRLEEHSQLGTGSTDFSLGLVATMEDPGKGLWFAGLRGRWNGKNKEDYRYGNALFYNIGYSKTLDPGAAVIFELNGRFAGKDRTESGEKDENSGGHFGYLSLSYRRDIGKELGFVAAYQIPVFRRLNGSQSESGLLTIGFFRKV